jgi:hypothetical protein
MRFLGSRRRIDVCWELEAKVYCKHRFKNNIRRHEVVLTFFGGGGWGGFLSTFVSKGCQFATESINRISSSVYYVVDTRHRQVTNS